MIRLQNVRKIPAGLLSYFRIEILSRRIVGHRDVNWPPEIIRFLNHLLQPSEQNLIVPPKAGIDGKVCLENWRAAQEGVHGEQTSERMPHQNPIGLGPVFGLNVRDEFFFEKPQEQFPAPTRGEIRFLLS